MNIQILTATETLDQLDLERLRLSICRVGDRQLMDDVLNADVDMLVELEGAVIASDISKVSFIRDGDYVFVRETYRNLDSLARAVQQANHVDAMGMRTGLLESDLTDLTITHVQHGEFTERLVQWYVNLAVAITKRDFYL